MLLADPVLLFGTGSDEKLEAFPSNRLFNRGQCVEAKLCKLNLTGAVSFLASIDYKIKANFAKKI